MQFRNILTLRYFKITFFKMSFFPVRIFVKYELYSNRSSRKLSKAAIFFSLEFF